MTGRGWIGTLVGLFAFWGGCQVVGDLPPELVLASGDEICGDGVDDDEDGLADCADPDCAASTCVPNAPPGWEGPFWVRRSAWDGMSGPSCPDGLAGSAHYMIPTQAACTPCGCGDVQGGACSPPKLRCWASANCTGNAVDASVGNVGQCDNPYGFGGSPGTVSCQLIEPGNLQSNGMCAPGGGALAETKPFQEILSACMLGAGAGCEEGASCAPPVEGGARLCIRTSGDAACPDGWTADSMNAYSSGQDMRTCGACTCLPQGTTCQGGTYRAFDTLACQPGEPGSNLDPPIDIAGEACFDLSLLADLGSFSVRALSNSVLGGTCQAAGGAPSGSIVPEGPVQYCCR